MAAIAALETLAGPSTVDLYTDSRYLVDAIEKGWARKWQAKGWMRNKREKALNPDLWARLLTDLATHNVKLHWVRGHAGNRENERCDRLAVAAIRSKKSIDDEGFLRPSSPGPCTTNMF